MKRNWKYLISGLAGASMLAGSSHAAVVEITDADITGVHHWTADNTYYLKGGFVHVERGEEIHIAPGTVIKGALGQNAAATALIVARGGKLYAEGNPDNPIIFTTELDETVGEDVNAGTTGYTTFFFAQATERWGGLVMLGEAVINSAKDSSGNIATPKYELFEGMTDDNGINSGEPVHRFGGDNDADSSGVLRYVQIRYAGTEFATDAELNGLTLGGVGSGTKLDYVEVLNGSDDGIEWWGGTVNATHLVVSYCEDDSLDFDQGYRGTNQFVFVYQSGTYDKGAEIDGDLSPSDQNTPLTQFQLWNATFIGPNDATALRIRDQAMPRIYNSVFEGYSKFLTYEADNQVAVTAGEVKIKNNIFGSAAPSDTNVTGGEPDASNLAVSPMLINAEPSVDIPYFDPRPAAGSPALDSANVLSVPAEGILCPVDYVGAFAPNDLWITRWTAFDQFGLIERNGTGFLGTGEVVQITDASITGTHTWYRTNTYQLTGFVHIERGEELYIEPGTVIKGSTGQNAAATALFAARGGKLYAEGTVNNPIIFTTELDSTVGKTVNGSETFLGVSAQATDRWGGVVLLGEAVINSAKDATGNTSSPKYELFEGMNDDMGIDTSEFVHRFGGNNDTDSSGVMAYCQIRYAGTEFATDAELNGLTLGAVGSGTELHHIEVINGSDDGIEWWGGTVNAKCLVVTFCEDDSVDFDQGYTGKNQFVFVFQSGTRDKGAEIDGDLSPGDQNTPLTQFSIYNATFIGDGGGTALRIRDNAMPRIHNSVLAQYGTIVSYEPDNQTAVTAGEVQIMNNILEMAATRSSTSGTPEVTGGDLDASNLSVDPMLVNDTLAMGAIDPRPLAGAAALDGANLKTITEDGFLSDPGFLGAFGENENWAVDWTAVASFGLMSSKGGMNVKKTPAGVAAGAPTFAEGNNGGSAVTGGSVTLSADVLGGGTITYVWKDPSGMVIPGETGPTLTISPVNSSTVGLYSVTVDNGVGSATKTFVVSTVNINTFAGVVIEGTVGEKFRVEYTTDLNNPSYTVLDTVTLATSTMIYVDTTASIESQTTRFYRAVPLEAQGSNEL